MTADDEQNRIQKEYLSEPMSLCLNCGAKGDGLVKVCEHCGAKHSNRPYKTRIEYYFDYEDIIKAFQQLQKRDSEQNKKIKEHEKKIEELCDFKLEALNTRNSITKLHDKLKKQEKDIKRLNNAFDNLYKQAERNFKKEVRRTRDNMLKGNLDMTNKKIKEQEKEIEEKDKLLYNEKKSCRKCGVKVERKNYSELMLNPKLELIDLCPKHLGEDYAKAD